MKKENTNEESNADNGYPLLGDCDRLKDIVKDDKTFKNKLIFVSNNAVIQGAGKLALAVVKEIDKQNINEKEKNLIYKIITQEFKKIEKKANKAGHIT